MSNEGTVYDQYFEWLYSHVANPRNRNPERSRWNLLRKLYSTPFIYFTGNDDNRASDGIELRIEWVHRRHLENSVDPLWYDLDCSILEMLIALSRRLEFQTGSPYVEWFWQLMTNLGIADYTDDIYEISIEEEVEEVLDRLINRTYGASGEGGLFPLKNPTRDQREIEIWYQMSAYLLELHHIAPLVLD